MKNKYENVDEKVGERCCWGRLMKKLMKKFDENVDEKV
jgi:hypothetical protein